MKPWPISSRLAGAGLDLKNDGRAVAGFKHAVQLAKAHEKPVLDVSLLPAQNPIVGGRQLLRGFTTHAVLNQPAERQVGISHRFWRVHLVEEGVVRRVAAITLCADGQQHDPSD